MVWELCSACDNYTDSIHKLGTTNVYVCYPCYSIMIQEILPKTEVDLLEYAQDLIPKFSDSIGLSRLLVAKELSTILKILDAPFEISSVDSLFIKIWLKYRLELNHVKGF